MVTLFFTLDYGDGCQAQCMMGYALSLQSLTLWDSGLGGVSSMVTRARSQTMFRSLAAGQKGGYVGVCVCVCNNLT